MTQPHILVTTDQAADILGVPPGQIAKWKHRGDVSPDGILPGRGRGGMAPLYRLDLLQPLAEEYHRRAATRRQSVDS